MESKKKTHQVVKALKSKIKGLIREKTISDSDLAPIKASCLSDPEVAKEIEAYLYSLHDRFQGKKRIDKYARVSQIIEFMMQDPTFLYKLSDSSSSSSFSDDLSDYEVFGNEPTQNPQKLDSTQTPQNPEAKSLENAKLSDFQTVGKDEQKENAPKKIDEEEKKEPKERPAREPREIDPEKLKKLQEMRAEKQKEKERLKELRAQEKEREREEKRKLKEAEKQKKLEKKMLEKMKKALEKEFIKGKKQQEPLPDPSKGIPSAEPQKVGEDDAKKEESKQPEVSQEKEKPKDDSNVLSKLSELVPFGVSSKEKFSLGEKPIFPEDPEHVFIEKSISELRQHDIEEVERQICSMLNTKGGRIYFGINHRRVVVGDQSPAPLIQKFVLKIALLVEDGFYPKLQSSYIKVDRIPIQNSETHNLLRIDVQKGEKFKLYCTSKGKYFFRNQGMLSKYSPEQVQDIITENAIKAQEEGVSIERKEDKAENNSNFDEDQMSEMNERGCWHHRSKHCGPRFPDGYPGPGSGWGWRHKHHGFRRMMPPPPFYGGGYGFGGPGPCDPRMMPPPYSYPGHPYMYPQMQPPYYNNPSMMQPMQQQPMQSLQQQPMQQFPQQQQPMQSLQQQPMQQQPMQQFPQQQQPMQSLQQQQPIQQQQSQQQQPQQQSSQMPQQQLFQQPQQQFGPEFYQYGGYPQFMSMNRPPTFTGPSSNTPEEK